MKGCCNSLQVEDSTDQPRSLKNSAERDRRRMMLNEAHMKPLKEYAKRLSKCCSGEILNFDPMDGGIHAKIRFLFEKPGPMTVSRGGSGFISRNNDDPTADNTWHIMKEAGIPRKATCTWNIVPEWNDNKIKVTSEEKARSILYLAELFSLFNDLKIIVLVGGTAKSAKKKIEKMTIVQQRGIKIMTSYHPAQRVKNRYKEKFATIKNDWSEAYSELCSGVL